MMVSTLKDMCMEKVFKFGIGPRDYLPAELQAELKEKEATMQLDLTGRYYKDSHITAEQACEFDIDWRLGKWSLLLKFAGRRHSITIKAGENATLGWEWKRIFLFFNERLYDGFGDFVIQTFDIQVVHRSVVFHGYFENWYGESRCFFKTRFTFSVSSHCLKLETYVKTAGIFMLVGKRWMFQPDTRDLDFFR